MPKTAVYDACVLYPAPLRDLLVRVALAGLCRARWTDQIHDEWVRNVAANRPDLSIKSLARCRQLMDANIPDALVTGFEPLIPTLSLPDPDDCHVLAAAVHAEADLIVTFNLSDFPKTALAPHTVEAVHPDEFVVQLLADSAGDVCEAVRLQRAALRRPPKTVEEFLPTLDQCGLSKSVAVLRTFADRL